MWLSAFTILVYASLLYELVGIPVPSIASTYQLVFPPENDGNSSGRLLTRVRGWPLWVKGVLLFLPTAGVVIVYLLPLLQVVVPPINHLLHPLTEATPGWLVGCGMGLATVGRVIGLTAAWILHHDHPPAAVRADDAPALRLRTRGLFAVTRNPILIGMGMTFLGLWCLYPTLEMGVGFVLFAGNMHFRVLLEEDFLTARFGEPYRQFVAETGRYLAWPRRASRSN